MPLKGRAMKLKDRIWNTVLKGVGLMFFGLGLGFAMVWFDDLDGETDLVYQFEGAIVHERSHAFSAGIESLPCNFGTAKLSPDHKLRLAMIVGIDRYAARWPRIPNLKGAVNDAGKIYSLLASGNAGVFPDENICILTNEEATLAGFTDAFQKSLVDRAVTSDGKAADQIVIYFSGHGSHRRDRNGDEPDGYDETLVMHDSRTGWISSRVPDLLDDQFNSMLTTLSLKSQNITVILDACNSGTATRSFDGRTIARSVSPEDEDGEGRASHEKSGSESGFQFLPEKLGNAVFLSAARDTEVAYEKDGAGLFTNALFKVMTGSTDRNITYSQLVQRIRSELGMQAQQTPVVSGQSERIVFTNDIPLRPLFGWMVTTVEGDKLRLTGLPTPGMGIGAQFLIMPGSVSVDETRVRELALAQAIIKEMPSGNVAVAEIVKTYENARPIVASDIGVMNRPSTDARRLKVRIRPASEQGGISDAGALEIELRQQIIEVFKFADDDLISFVDAGPDFEIAIDHEGRYQIADPMGHVRNSSLKVSDIAEDLINHLAQMTLLKDWRVESGDMTANKTIRVSMVPIPQQGGWNGHCRPNFEVLPWPEAKPNSEQEIPLCSRYGVRIEVEEKEEKGETRESLIIGAAIMSADGMMYPLPCNKVGLELKGGQSETLEDPTLPNSKTIECNNHFQAFPDGLGAPEFIYVIGLPAKLTAGGVETATDFQIPWNLLSTERKKERSARNISDKEARMEYGTYTIVPFRVVTNNHLPLRTDRQIDKDVARHEFTLPGFNIEAYLPDDNENALRRVLTVASDLASGGTTNEGVSYGVHNWCGGSDVTNLARGMDASRAIWYAFSRAGLPYNRYANGNFSEDLCNSSYSPQIDGYLHTGDMVRPGSLMSDEFEMCGASGISQGADLWLGDVLIYRDTETGDGHAVIVIDPKEQVVWGSLGWDNPSGSLDPNHPQYPAGDLGVAFQRMMLPLDRARWGRPDMELAACWRYREIAKAAASPAGRPGLKAICRASTDGQKLKGTGSVCEE